MKYHPAILCLLLAGCHSEGDRIATLAAKDFATKVAAGDSKGAYNLCTAKYRDHYKEPDFKECIEAALPDKGSKAIIMDVHKAKIQESIDSPLFPDPGSENLGWFDVSLEDPHGNLQFMVLHLQNNHGTAHINSVTIQKDAL